MLPPLRFWWVWVAHQLHDGLFTLVPMLLGMVLGALKYTPRRGTALRAPWLSTSGPQLGVPSTPGCAPWVRTAGLALLMRRCGAFAPLQLQDAVAQSALALIQGQHERAAAACGGSPAVPSDASTEAARVIAGRLQALGHPAARQVEVALMPGPLAAEEGDPQMHEVTV